MINLIYLVLAIILGCISWRLNKIIWGRYYTLDTKRSFLYVSRIPVAIFYPKPFFKKKDFWKGYLTYLLEWLIGGLALYFLFKLVGILK